MLLDSFSNHHYDTRNWSPTCSRMHLHDLGLMLISRIKVIKYLLNLNITDVKNNQQWYLPVNKMDKYVFPAQFNNPIKRELHFFFPIIFFNNSLLFSLHSFWMTPSIFTYSVFHFNVHMTYFVSTKYLHVLLLLGQSVIKFYLPQNL